MDVCIQVTEANIGVSASEGTRVLLSSPGTTSAVFPRILLLPARELVLVGGSSPRAPDLVRF